MLKPILVIGDACLDKFIYCRCDRLSPEMAIPVLDVLETHSNLGMAGNVYRNIKALDYPVCHIFNDNYKKVTKTRLVEKKTYHHFVRVDSPDKISRISQDELKAIKWDKYAAIVISDYQKGFLNEYDIEYISNRHHLTVMDTKKILGPWAKNITFIKINRKEYSLSLEKIREYKLADKIIQTLGEDGAEYRNIIYPVKEVQIKNLSGAGDSHIAAFTVKYVQIKDVAESIKYANEVASIVVTRTGVSTIKD